MRIAPPENSAQAMPFGFPAKVVRPRAGILAMKRTVTCPLKRRFRGRLQVVERAGVESGFEVVHALANQRLVGPFVILTGRFYRLSDGLRPVAVVL